MTESTKPVWLITGCDKGLGYGIAEAALRNGATVVGTLLQTDAKSPLTDQFPGLFHARHLDVTNTAQAHRIVHDAEAQFGGIDVLVNNAGFGLVGAAEETMPDEYRPIFEVNFFGMIELTRAALAGMRSRRRGHIINMSSLVGFVGSAGFCFYSASKFAVEGFSESLAKEVGPLGIKVSIIEPGGFRTDFAGGSLARAKSIIPDYDATSGGMREYLRSRNGTQPGDPGKLGDVLWKISTLDHPPLRLCLGPDALTAIRSVAADRVRELDRWETLTLSTSFDT